MAEGITIPSPSVFLRQSPPPAAPNPDTASRPNRQHTRRPSKGSKKIAFKKGPQSVAGDGSVTKPKQSKSRNGCVTCKAKRLKCGEEKPTCHQCARRNVECGGYKKDFKWRPFEETNVKLNIDRQKQATSPKWHLALAPSKSTSPVNEARPRDTEVFQHQLDSNSPSRSPISDNSEAHRPQNVTPPADSPQKNDTPAQESPHASPIQEQPEPAPPPEKDARSRASSEESVHNSVPPLSHPIARVMTPIQSQGNSPTLTETMQSCPGLHVGHHQDFVNFSLPEDMHLPLPSSSPDNMALDEDLLILGTSDAVDSENIPDFGGAMIWPLQAEDPLVFATPDGMEQAMTLWPNRLHYMYQQPSMVQDSMESLTARFDNLTCGILSVMDGPSENPWRNLIWPLARQSQALHHAVAAMAAFHSSADFPHLRIKGGEHKAASLRYIHEGIRDNSISDETAIATALALGFSESWDQHTATGNTHIKGAQALVKRALRRHRRNPLQGVELARLKFLCNAWVYMDVIARLTSFDSDDSNDFDSTFLFTPDPPKDAEVNTTQGFGIDFGMPIDARLDPLMGCANTLFPLIGRVANLVRKVYRQLCNSPSVISQANDLKTSLEAWRPPEYIERPEDPSTEVQHTLQTAEAYRWATLLHLHQSVPEIPSPPSAELAQRALQYLATVPLTSRTTIVHIYPLMVAGCEARDAEDRGWVRERWAHMAQRMRIGVIDKCVQATEEVWRRRDEYESRPLPRGRVVATADLQPARQIRGERQGSQQHHHHHPPFFGRRPMTAPAMTDFFSPSSSSADRPVAAAAAGRNSPVGFGGVVDADAGRVLPQPPTTTTAATTPAARTRSKIPDQGVGFMDPEYSVRGHLHWVAVMWDWQWEILLG